MALALALEGPATGPEEEGVVGEAARISGGKRAARALMPAVMASRLLRSTSFCAPAGLECVSVWATGVKEGCGGGARG